VTGLSNVELWKRISDYQFDTTDVELSFVQRLASENGWTSEFSSSAINEYKRFAYLACVTDGVVTPSYAVDQVWHRHLVNTRQYWNTFCGEVLGRELHHTPSTGGAAEAEKYRAGYQLTLARYRDEFGVDAPANIWPPTDERFATGQRLSVDTSSVVVVPKTTVNTVLGLGVSTGLGAAGIVGAIFASPVLLILCVFGVFLSFATLARETRFGVEHTITIGGGSSGDGDGDGGGDGGGCGGD
jgi:hypothetical protein